MAKYAGRAEKSPANRCQATPSAGKILPRGPIPSIWSPGRAIATQRSPGPPSCRTMPRVSRPCTVSMSLMVYLRRTGRSPSTATISMKSCPGR